MAARSHARRLEREGWLARYSMTRGDGCLFLATRTGVAVAGVAARVAGPPAPTWWAHHCAVAWAAAWVRLRGHHLMGARELLEGGEWSGEISWRDRSGFRTATHRPDLVARRVGGGQVTVEVELTKKSNERLRAILFQHAEWRVSGQTGGVIYVCGDEDIGQRLVLLGADVGLTTEDGLRIELLGTIVSQAVEASEARRRGRFPRGSADMPPMLAVDAG